MKTSNASAKTALVVMLAAVMAVAALAGCAKTEASSSESSSSASSSASSSSSTASIETLSPSAASPSSSSAASSSTSAPSTTSASYTTYVNEQEGYMFEVSSSFATESSGSTARVYTAKAGEAPFFTLSVMRNPTGQTEEELLSGVGQKAIEEYGDKIVKGPVANTVKLHNRQIKGIEYIVQDGGKQKAVYQYAEVINGSFFTWSGVATADDTTTPAAMQHAMDTLQFKTA